MKESPSILKNDDADDSFDLFELKDKGLNKIQLLSGNNWTDYNSHDPGVTILETLCYALTDLAYRSDFDIATILNTTGRKKIKNSLFPAHQILTTSPLSFFDFKRLILDIDGIKNGEFIPAYSEKVIPGVFDIEIELHPDFDNDISRDNIKKKIHLFIKSVCPLGVVFEKITFLEYDLIGIILDVELSEDVDPKKICAQFIQHAQNYFSSEIKFNSLNDLLEKNIGVETIFDGPLLKNGFLLNEQLLNQTVRKRIFVSDLINLAMSIQGVSFVRNLKISDDNKNEFNWIYDIKSSYTPRLDTKNSNFKFLYKNTLIFESNPSFIELWSSPKLNNSSSYNQNILDLPVGTNKKLSKYHSVQYDFPDTFGIGFKGPSAGAGPEIIAAAKQFKGYLMIYDQIMANFLAQLDHLKYLFSTENIETTSATQLIDDIPGVEYLYKYFIEDYYIKYNNFNDKIHLKSEWTNYLNKSRTQLSKDIQNSFETKEEYLNRRNSVLDHLLARFGIDTSKFELLSEMLQVEAINYKIDLLQNFPTLSSERYITGKSSLYPQINGLKAWIGKNLNLKGFTNETITSSIAHLSSGSLIKAEIYSINNPLNVFLKNGIELENIIETGANEVSIFNNKELISKVNIDYEFSDDIRKFVHQKIVDIDNNSENFKIIDHLSLRPDIDFLCYGFNVMFDNKSIFMSERLYTLNHCDLFIKKFIGLSKDLNNFKIIESALKEYRISFECEYGKLLSRSYYSSRSEAIDKLEYYLDSNNSNLLNYTYTTKYEDYFSNVNNPFSYIVTIILPSWPTKFQKKGFKKYVEEFFYQELPAHLVVNIKWFDFDTMLDFEKSYLDYNNNLNSTDILLKTKSLDKLLSTIIS